MDRGIHRETIQVSGGKDLTVYYLNALHEFGPQTETVRLVLSGEWGQDVPIGSLSTSGSFFVTTLVLPPGTIFDPTQIHRQASEDFTSRSPEYQGIFLAQLQEELSRLPEELIIFAEHPVLLEQEDYPDLEFYFQNTPYLAARYWPLTQVDENGRATGPSDWANALTRYLLEEEPVPAGPLDFPVDVLVFLPGS